MNLLTLIISLIQMRGSELTGNAWTDAFLDRMVGVEQMFFNISWGIWAIIIALFLIGALAKHFVGIDFDGLGWGCGCLSALLLAWPLMEWISLFLIQGMANNFNAEVGLANPVAFVIYLLLYISFGAG